MAVFGGESAHSRRRRVETDTGQGFVNANILLI